MKNYPFNIKAGSKARLQKYREEAATSKHEAGKNWRYWVRKIFDTPNNVRQDGMIFSDSIDQYGCEVADDTLRNRVLCHGGWYCDSFQSGLFVPTVTKMRTPRGTLYIPASYCTEWDGTTHYIGDAVLVPKGEDWHDDAIKDALRYADHHCEREAEESREYQAKDQAEYEISECRAEIHAINKSALALIREAKGQQFSPVICDALLNTLQSMLRERSDKFSRIAELQENFWLAVQ